MSAANDAFATTGRTEFSFDSADGKSQVRAVLWVPLAMERAILRAVQSAGSAYGLIGWEDLPR